MKFVSGPRHSTRGTPYLPKKNPWGCSSWQRRQPRKTPFSQQRSNGYERGLTPHLKLYAQVLHPSGRTCSRSSACGSAPSSPYLEDRPQFRETGTNSLDWHSPLLLGIYQRPVWTLRRSLSSPVLRTILRTTLFPHLHARTSPRLACSPCARVSIPAPFDLPEPKVAQMTYIDVNCY